MATHARAEVTLTDQTDAEALVTWYRLTTSATKPSKPTTTAASATPSGWAKTEPAYSGGSTSYLYTCLQLVWGDGTCDWGDVQLSSSYEAAKAAWNKAQAAADAAAATSQYFWHDSGGAHVSTVAGSTASGDSATLTGGALTFAHGGETVASFGQTLIRLGRWLSTTRAGDTATIELMGGSGSITLTVGETRDLMEIGATGGITLSAYDNVSVVTTRGYSGLTVNGSYAMVEPDVLYDSDGTTGTVVLSASAAGYDHMRIHYYTTDGGPQPHTYDSAEVYEPDGRRVSLSALRMAQSDYTVYMSNRVVLVSGTTITDVTHSQSQYGANTGVNTVNDIYIHRVEAWRSVSHA